jgi:GNAT superfamily N-acetyltransferase
MEDAAALAELRWRWYEERHGSGVLAAEFKPWFIGWLAENISTHLPYVAVVDHRVCGMAWLVLASRVPAPIVRSRPSGDIQAVYVIPELRNGGVGGSLLAAVLGEARERGLELVTVHSAPRAVTFYRRLGFNPARDWLEWRPPAADA